MGYGALDAADTENDNLAIGYDALGGSIAGGEYNVAIGNYSLDATTSGDKNTAIGYDAMTANSTGSNNTASGYESLKSNTTGTYNAASGYQALKSNTTGQRNAAFGNQALMSNTGSKNTAIGSHALYVNSSGENNSGLGYYALGLNTTGSYNTGSGSYALNSVTTGSQNSGLGYQAGAVITTGSNNTMLGYSADPSAADGENQIVIGYGATGTGNNEIALGNTSISAIKAQVTSITGYSDSRIKRDIRNNDLGLAFINKLRTVKYKLKNPADYPLALREKRFMEGNEKRPQDDEKIYDGLIAQEVKAVIDELGIEWSGWSKNDSDGKQGIQYGALTVPLIKAVQEQQAQIEILQRQYAQVTSQNQELMKLVSTQLLKKNDAEVKLIRSDESNNDDKSETVITSMK
jgi:hypothetical protein